jgi:lysophospholipase L1-like esterase
MAVALVSLGALGPARAQPASVAAEPPPQAGHTRSATADRWKETFDAFAAEDKLHAPRPGGVLFVGSSSIRLWDSLEKDFDALPIVTRRGFGGSRLSDCAEHVTRLVLPNGTRLVILYAGDNDLAEGATPQDVLASFILFVKAVNAKLPDTRIAYVSIKPSPLRAALIDKARDANALIAAYASHHPNLDYIDIYSRMLAPDGTPRKELYAPDMLHLNRDGYALWREQIASHLGPVLPSTALPDVASAATGARRASP